MRIHFLFGTESGTAEFLCDDLSDATPASFECDVSSLTAISPEALQEGTLYVLISSTFGSGDLPGTAQKFYDDLKAQSPDLSHIRFAVFGLGDKTFGETYNFGSKKLMEQMLACKAKMIGGRGLYDGSEPVAPEDVALPWWLNILEQIPQPAQ